MLWEPEVMEKSEKIHFKPQKCAAKKEDQPRQKGIYEDMIARPRGGREKAVIQQHRQTPRTTGGRFNHQHQIIGRLKEKCGKKSWELYRQSGNGGPSIGGIYVA